MTYWKDAPPLHISLSGLLSAFGGKKTASSAPRATPTGTPDDWASMTTTAPKPTPAELRLVVDQLHR